MLLLYCCTATTVPLHSLHHIVSAIDLIPVFNAVMFRDVDPQCIRSVHGGAVSMVHGSWSMVLVVVDMFAVFWSSDPVRIAVYL